jgi:hypothetical protein
MTTDVYPRENCIAPAIVFIVVHIRASLRNERSPTRRLVHTNPVCQGSEVHRMDDASWDKLFTTATLTDYQREDVVRALPGHRLGPRKGLVSLQGLGMGR